MVSYEFILANDLLILTQELNNLFTDSSFMASNLGEKDKLHKELEKLSNTIVLSSV